MAKLTWQEHTVKQQDIKINNFWVWKLVNIELKFKINLNLNVKNKKQKKNINQSKVKTKTNIFTVWPGQHKLITCNLTKNKKWLKQAKIAKSNNK